MFPSVAAHFNEKEIIIDLIFLLGLLLAWFAPEFGSGLFVPVEKLATRFARRRRSVIVWIALLTIAVRLSLLGLLPVPVPRVHDEFSYLLAADTFAHGRLTNPTHPMWIFFDTIHVNQHPTYMSKYPPAQGAVLAVGEILGHPWIGVLLSCAAICAAVLWMLQGWLPPRWALLGGTLVLLRLGIFSYWMNSYWGGAVPATGGALVLGATPRLVHFRRWSDAVVLGLGAAILANSRPMEGLVLCLSAMGFLVVSFCGKSSVARQVSLLRLIMPFSATLLLCGIFMGYYNWRGTGNPLMFPYAANEKIYVTTPTFFWEKARPPLHYLDPQFEAFYNGCERTQWLEGRVSSVAQAVRHIGLSGVKTAYFFLWPELCLPLLALPWIFRDHRIRFLIVAVAISFLGFLLVPWTQAHYAAPLTAALFALVVQGIRHLRRWEHGGRPVGICLSRTIVLFSVLLATLHPHAQAMGNPGPEGIEYRAEFEKQLSSRPGQHLVIVRYSSGHGVLQEWVYNHADIEHAKVVWAREIPGVDIHPLLNFFRSRRVWLAEPDASPPRLTPCGELPWLNPVE